MCDAQGRQFNYACPNETLFQQRMLICDHWYMVDCSSSEANYEFNRLIGQRDQPFVSESDAEKRTPRPDLLDRPYAADYKGESYRKQFGKNKFQAIQNAIPSFAKVENKKLEILETQASSHVLPPQIHSNDLDPTLIPASEDFPLIDKNNGRRNADSGEVRGNGMRPPPTGFEPPKLLPTYNQEFRNREESRLKQLGLPLQQTSQRVQQPAAAQFPQQPLRPVVSNQAFQSTKKPVVKTFNPDLNFKAFEHIIQPGKKASHKDYDFSRYFTKKDGGATVAPLQRRQDVGTGFNRQQSVAQPTTARPFVNKFSQQTQRTFAPITRQVVTTRTTPKTTTTVRTTTRTTTRPTTRTTTSTTRRPATQPPSRVQQSLNQNQQKTQLNQGFNRATTTVQSKPATQAAFNRNSIPVARQPAFETPARDLLPPLDGSPNYEDGTTKGPAIYSQWKMPERGLVPPKLDNETDEMHSKRSILEEGNFGTNNNNFQTSETRRLGNGNTIKVQYKDLQRLFSIPEYEFPLESKGRDGYENAEAVNSFQVKIPYKSGNSDRYYYLEHSHCNPECHPYFFKPNRCEPCVKL